MKSVTTRVAWSTSATLSCLRAPAFTLPSIIIITPDQLNNANGDKISSVNINPGPGPGVTVNLRVDVDIDVIVPLMMWVAPPKILGAHYGGFIAPSFANSGLDAALSTATGRGIGTTSKTFGVGDLFVEPIWLDWSLTHWDFGIAYGFSAPVGKYNTQTITLPRIGRSVTVESNRQHWVRFLGATSASLDGVVSDGEQGHSFRNGFDLQHVRKEGGFQSYAGRLAYSQLGESASSFP